MLLEVILYDFFDEKQSKKHIYKNKGQISCIVNAEMSSTFVIATKIYMYIAIPIFPIFIISNLWPSALII